MHVTNESSHNVALLSKIRILYIRQAFQHFNSYVLFILNIKEYFFPSLFEKEEDKEEEG